MEESRLYMAGRLNRTMRGEGEANGGSGDPRAKTIFSK